MQEVKSSILSVSTRMIRSAVWQAFYFLYKHEMYSGGSYDTAISETAQDFGHLRSLSIRAYFEIFALRNTKENMNAYLKEVFPKEKFRGELAEICSSFYFLYDRGNIAGYMIVNEVPAQENLKDSDPWKWERIYSASRKLKYLQIVFYVWKEILCHWRRVKGRNTKRLFIQFPLFI